jgi:hypothetical protein
MHPDRPRRQGRISYQRRRVECAVVGVGMVAWFTAALTPDRDYLTLMDAAFAHLEAGLPLQARSATT